MSAKTIFKRIIDKEIPAKIAYEDGQCLAFHDVNPQAPVHVLLIPKKEIPSLNHQDAEDQMLYGHMLLIVPKIAELLGLSGGYRLVVNCGPDAGQTVDHLHLHIMG